MNCLIMQNGLVAKLNSQRKILFYFSPLRFITEVFLLFILLTIKRDLIYLPSRVILSSILIYACGEIQ